MRQNAPIVSSQAAIGGRDQDELLLVFHIAAVHQDSGTVVVQQTPAGWLLPTCAAAQYTTQGVVLVKAMATLPFPAVPRCIAYPRLDAATHSREYLLIADVSNPSLQVGELRMIPIEQLRSTPCVIPHQRTVIERLVGPVSTRSTVALQPSWIHQVTRWVSREMRLHEEPLLVRSKIYRAGDASVVLTLELANQIVHFKASGSDCFREAELTQFIADVAPDQIVPTLSFDPERRWWLTEHVDGVHPPPDAWPVHLSVVEQWIQLQHRLKDHLDALSALGISRLTPDDLRHAARDAAETLGDNRLPRRVLAHGQWSARRNLRDVVLARVDRLVEQSADVISTESILHFDLAPRNVLWRDGACVFLDFDSIYLGPSSICGELMARRLKRELTADQRWQLSRHAIRACNVRHDRNIWPSHGRIVALTDLYLLAILHGARRRASSGEMGSAPSYGWSHLAADFVSRSDHWSLSD